MIFCVYINYVKTAKQIYTITNNPLYIDDKVENTYTLPPWSSSPQTPVPSTILPVL